MSHHGNHRPDPEIHEAMKKLLGEYPQGRLNASDAGAVAMSVSTENGRVILNFPKPVAWIGMTAQEAIGLAEMLVKHARTVGSKEPLTFKF